MNTCPTCKGKGAIECRGVRECFVPRPGWAYIDVDFPSLELRTLAEVQYEWLGRSTLGELYNSDPDADPHAMVAALILDCPYEVAKKRCKDKKDTEADNARQAGKVVNFGLPGGLGPKRLVDFAWKSYGVKLGETQEAAERKAAELREVFEATWPEMNRRDPNGYFGYIRRYQRSDDTYTLEMPKTGVVRAGMTYTQAANSPFQHLGAACAKRGLVLVSKDCYLPGSSPLRGGRVANMIHDQLLVEIPYQTWGPDRAHAAAHRVADLFATGARAFLDRVPIRCEPLLTLCWSKKAEAVHDDQGRLVPWSEVA